MRVWNIVVVLLLLSGSVSAQAIQWTSDAQGYYDIADGGDITLRQLPDLTTTTFLTAAALTPAGSTEPLSVDAFSLSEDGNKVLIYTNSQRVWRYKTRGDYWVLDRTTGSLRQLGTDRPEASLMFAKFDPAGTRVAYVSERNIYVEDLASGTVRALTASVGNPKLINGTFDWVYEEEFMLRDGFRWSPNGQHIAYWQLDASQIRDFYMIDNTDSVYSRIIPVEYPKVGFPPSTARIGVVTVTNAQTRWMDVPGDPQQHYLVRMEWTPDGEEVAVQQLNRRQNESIIFFCRPTDGTAREVYREQDEAWVSHINEWNSDVTGWDWLEDGQAFVWTSERDGWRHLYRVPRDGTAATLLSPGDYDVINTLAIDEERNVIYYYASPANATQQYLYELPLRVGKARRRGAPTARTPRRISPAAMPGTHRYTVSPDGRYARWSFSNHYTRPQEAWVSLPDHRPLKDQTDLRTVVDTSQRRQSATEYFQVTTEEGVTLDGWMTKPSNFDPTQKYPVVFYVYGEPAATTVTDRWGAANNFLYLGNMADDGYIHISLDNRGTPAPRGRAWRKAIYRQIGQLNIRDQALAAKKILEWPYTDSERVAVWGWSGGGSSTLNLLFQYPDIYQTGVAVAPVTSSLLYDNIYTERYMGLPEEAIEDYVAGAALTHAKQLRGNLLLVHGTADDNVHFQNAELLVNELVKNNKQFRYMAYPGRSHGMSEGQGTFLHLATMCTAFLRENCSAGGRKK